MDNRHYFRMGFAVRKKYESSVSEFNTISERMCTMQLRTTPKKVCLINIYAPTENSDEADKDECYEEITKTYDRLPGTAIKIMLEDANAKIRKELMYVPSMD